MERDMQQRLTVTALVIPVALVLLAGPLAAQGAVDPDAPFVIPTDGLFQMPEDVGWFHTYVDLWWCAGFVAVSGLILWMAKWIDEDSHRLAINTAQWNCATIAVALASLVAFFLIPPWASLPAALAALLVVFWRYIPVRNRKVLPTRRLFTASHRSLMWTKFVAFFGVKPRGLERKLARVAKVHVPVALFFQTGSIASPAEAPPDEEDAATHVKEVVGEAAKRHAREAYLQPQGSKLSVSFRIDGMPHEGISLERLHGTACIGLVKQLVDLGSEDPHFRIELPTKHGRFTVRVRVLGQGDRESVVLRMCPDGEEIRRVGELGFTPDQEGLVKQAFQESRGLIAVASPPAMGARTTVYAILDSLDPYSRNIVTFERPVTGHLATIEQNDLTGTDQPLREILKEKVRHDYDLLMLSEVPDKPTALIALTAGQRDQSMVARFELGDAVGVVGHLLNLGIARDTIASGLHSVVAQRLVRVLCEKCRTKVVPSSGLLQKIGMPPSQVEFFWEESSGCEACGMTGFHGRTGIFEVWRLGDESRRLIAKGSGAGKLREAAHADRMVSMQQSGLQKVLGGVTSLREVARVLKA